MPRDSLFKTNKRVKHSFVFDEKTAHVFDDMVNRSVPFYTEIQRMIAEITASFARAHSNVYDLGCSTGTTLLTLAQHIHEPGIKLIGMDSSEAMLEKVRQKFKKQRISLPCDLINKDLNLDFEIKNATVVIMNLTLQFVSPAKRPQVLSRIYKGLKKGGCLIFVEKILTNDKILDQKFIGFYNNLKMRHNYSKLEIRKKREALENVLISYTYDKNIKLLKTAGFKSVNSFFRWYNFCGIIAVKG